MTKPRWTPYDENKTEALLESGDFQQIIFELMKDTARIYRCASKILYQRLKNEAGKFTNRDLIVILGVSHDKYLAAVKTLDRLSRLPSAPDSKSRVLEESWRAGLAIEQGKKPN